MMFTLTMGYVIKMPKLGLEMEQGTVLEWTAEPDERFEEGDVLAEVESEKSIGEVEAREDGALRRVYVEEEETVPPGTPIGIAAAPDADISDLEAEAEAELADAAPEAAPAEAATAAAETGGSDTGSGGSDGVTAGGGETGGTDAPADVKASPRAERRADELGVDLATVEGTGFEGAITEEDVEAAAESTGETADEDAEPKASPRARKRADELGVDLATVEGTGFEGAITEEDVEAAAESAAETTTTDTAAPEAETPVPLTAGDVVRVAPSDDVADRYQRVTAVADPAAGEALFETMESVRTAFEERVTMTDVLLVLTAATLGDHPVLNGTYTESTHQVQDGRDIALVADVNGGRAVGVVSGAEHRSLSDLVEARQSIGVGDDGASGATFTLTNAAETEGTGRLANPPAVAALEVDPTGQRAVPDGDGVDLQPLVTASLTYDTRAVGAGEAEAFLADFFERAEDAPDLVLGSYRGTE
jgi:pyruvate/2-oxoglutarate dehydrogenase complex dihydrolipoamide acyltransferase (E2) component